MEQKAKKNTKVEDQKTAKKAVKDEVAQEDENVEETEGKTEEKVKKEEPKKEKTDAEKLQESEDKYLRLAAEYDNYRRRTLKEKSELIKTAGENILVGILPVIDDLDRAIDSMEKAEDIKSVKEGITLIYNKFKDFIKQKGVTEIEAQEKEFDTDVHEALTKIPAPSDKLKGKVVDVIEKGYYLNDKVIRFSKVVVGE